MHDGNTDYWAAYNEHVLRQAFERMARDLDAHLWDTGTERSGVSERREGEATFSTLDEIIAS